MRTYKKMSYSSYIKYIRKIQQYNDTLLEGITKCFTNKLTWYQCNMCHFRCRHKHDTMRHYYRIHKK